MKIFLDTSFSLPLRKFHDKLHDNRSTDLPIRRIVTLTGWASGDIGLVVTASCAREMSSTG